MTKPNALAVIFDLAIEARDNRERWETEYHSDIKSGDVAMKPWWQEVQRREVGGEVARLEAFCVPLRARPGRHIIIQLKLIVGGLTLPFSRVAPRRREKPGKLVLPKAAYRSAEALKEARRQLLFYDEVRRQRARAAAKAEAARATLKTPSWVRKRERKLRKARRWLQRFYGIDTPLPLVPDDRELRALVALRCLQQNCYTAAALSELRGYLRKIGVSTVDDVKNGVLSRVVEYFVSGPPDALRRHIKVMNRAVLAEEFHVGRATQKRAGAPLQTVLEAAEDLQVSPRTVYRWLESGTIVPVERTMGLNRVRIALREVERVRDARIAKLVYRGVMGLRDCSYDAARMWVLRRRAKGVPDREIVQEARAFRQPSRTRRGSN